MNNSFRNDVHIRGERRFADETVFVWGDPDEGSPVEVPVVLLEVFDNLTAVADCSLNEVLPGTDDDFLLGGHGALLSGGSLSLEL